MNLLKINFYNNYSESLHHTVMWLHCSIVLCTTTFKKSEEMWGMNGKL